MVEMVEHFPVLIVLLPLIAAPLCVAIRHGGSAWLLATLATWGSFAISIGLLLQVLDHGTVRYEIGNWVAPWGIEYVVDELNAYILLVITAIGSVVMPFALRSVPAEIGKRGVYLFYTMYLLCLSGLIGMTVTGDAFNVFVFLEISSLSSYTLISLGRNRKALYAAYQYLLMGTIGAIFFLIGVGLLYMMTGTLNMADLAARIDKVEDSRVIYTAFGFIVLGLGLKLAIFPLHAWLPNAYTFAPQRRQRLPGRHRHKSLPLPAAAFHLHGVRPRPCLRQAASRTADPGARCGRHRGLLAGGCMAAKHQAYSRVF